MDTPCPPAPAARTLRPTAADDRRRGDRHRLDVPATLTPSGSGGFADVPDGAPPLSAVITAFSVNGVGLRVAQPLTVDDVYVLNTFDTLIPPGLRIRVRSQRHTPAGDHEVGAEVV